MLSAVEHGEPLAQHLSHEPKVAKHHVLLLDEIGRRGQFSGFEPVKQARENPRIADGAPPYHEGVHTRAANHGDGVLGTEDAPVSKNGHLDRALHPRDGLQIHFAAEHGLAGSAVHGDGPRARILHRFGENLRRAFFDGVPACAHLHRHGYSHRAHHGGDDFIRLFGIFQERGARLVFRYLLDGAATVQVHDVRTRLLHHGRRLAHLDGVCAEKLDGDRLFRRVVAHQIVCFLVASNEGLATHHLGGHHARAMRLHQRAEGQVRIARHGRHDESVLDPHASDVQGRIETLRRRRNRLQRRLQYVRARFFRAHQFILPKTLSIRRLSEFP